MKNGGHVRPSAHHLSICNELLCSRRPLAEVLEELKRLSDKPIRDTVELGSSGPMIGLANAAAAVIGFRSAG
jgi:hypothetical protein